MAVAEPGAALKLRALIRYDEVHVAEAVALPAVSWMSMNCLQS